MAQVYYYKSIYLDLESTLIKSISDDHTNIIEHSQIERVRFGGFELNLAHTVYVLKRRGAPFSCAFLTTSDASLRSAPECLYI